MVLDGESSREMLDELSLNLSYYDFTHMTIGYTLMYVEHTFQLNGVVSVELSFDISNYNIVPSYDYSTEFEIRKLIYYNSYLRHKN